MGGNIKVVRRAAIGGRWLMQSEKETVNRHEEHPVKKYDAWAILGSRNSLNRRGFHGFFVIINTDVGAFCATKTASGCVCCHVFLSGEWVVWSEEAVCHLSACQRKHPTEEIHSTFSLILSLNFFFLLSLCVTWLLWCVPQEEEEKKHLLPEASNWVRNVWTEP